MRSIVIFLLATLTPVLGLLANQAPGAAAQGGGSLTIFNAACPPGYVGDTPAADCADDPVVGAEFGVNEIKADFFASGTTNAAGFVTLPLPPDILAGDVTVGQAPAVEVFDGEPPFVVSCTKDDGAEVVDVHYSMVQIDPGGDVFQVFVAAVPEDHIRCDWYDIPVAQDSGVPVVPLANAGIAEGGLGLTRAAWEAIHGPGELTDAYAPPYRPVYQYENGTYFVQFAGDGSDEDVVIYLEVAWAGDGAELTEAQATTQALLPADAELTEAFYAPRTPGGPTALRVFYATSDTLFAALGGLAGSVPSPNVLVIFHERLRDPQAVGVGESPDAITRVSLTAGLL